MTSHPSCLALKGEEHGIQETQTYTIQSFDICLEDEPRVGTLIRRNLVPSVEGFGEQERQFSHMKSGLSTLLATAQVIAVVELRF